jgi:hypothetical protein
LRPDGIPESRRWLRSNGKPVRPIEAMESLLQEHQGEMPSKELFDRLVSGGAFNRKSLPEARFKESIKTDIKDGFASGEEMSAEEIWLKSPSAIFPVVTRLKR